MANAWEQAPEVEATPAAQPAWMTAPEVHGGRRGGDSGHVQPYNINDPRNDDNVPLGQADAIAAAAAHTVGGAIKSAVDLPQAVWDMVDHSPMGGHPGAPAHPHYFPKFDEAVDAATYDPHTDYGKGVFDEASQAGHAVSGAVQKIPGAPEVLHALAPAARVVGDATAALPAVSRIGKFAEGVSESQAAAAARAGAGDATAPHRVAIEAGYDIPATQNPDAGMGSHVANSVAGAPNRIHDATLGNQVITNTHAGIEAGLPKGKRLNYDNLVEAETPHNQTLNKVADIVQDAPASTELNAALKKANGTDLLAEDDPRIQKIVDKINNKESLSGQDLLDVSRSTRARGRKYQSSPMPDQQEYGDSLLRVSNAIDDELERRLPPGAPLQAADVQNARTSLAKIHTVQDAMNGDNVDASALARLDKRNPGLLTGRLKIIAQTAANHPQVMGLGQKVVDAGGHLSTHQGAALIAAGTGAVLHNPALAGVALGAAGTRAVLRRVLARGANAGATAAEAADTNPALGRFFEQKVTPRPDNVLELTHPEGTAFEPNAPAPGPALNLKDVNPGEPFPEPTGRTNPTGARTLSPDGNSLPFERQFGRGEHGMGPDTGGLELAKDAPRSPPSNVGEISLADLLSHGVEQPAHPGLSLAPDYVRPSGLNIPGRTLADAFAPDLQTVEHVPGQRPNLSDVPAVMQEHPAPELALHDGVQTPRPPPTDAELAVPHGELPPVKLPAAAKAAPKSLGDAFDEEHGRRPPPLPEAAPPASDDIFTGDERPLGDHLTLADQKPRGAAQSGTKTSKTASGADVREVGSGVELHDRAVAPGSTVISRGPVDSPTSFIALTPQEDGSLRMTSAHSSVKGAGQKQIADAAQHAESVGKDLTSDTSVSREQLFAWKAAIDKGTVTATTQYQKEIDKILAGGGKTLKHNTPIYTDVKPVKK